MSSSDKLRYPVLLVHGMGFRDYKAVGYWGRIPKALEENGARVFFGKQDSNGSIESNAHQLRTALENALAVSGAEKVNIIAHSKGGLEARYLISSLGYADKVASLTTVSTPHNGSVTVDKLMKFPRGAVKLGCGVCDMWFRLLGDRSPNTYEAIKSFRTSDAKRFNAENPDAEGVYYQSYAFAMKKVTSDILMAVPWTVVNHFEGENDGLLSPNAVRWTNFKGVFYGSGGRGISHCDEVDMRRRKLSSEKDGDISDITDFYIDIINGLKELHF